MSRGQSQKLRKPAAIKSFHRTRVEPQRLGSDHQILASKRCALRRPFEHVLAPHRRHSHHLPKIQQLENSPFERAENSEWPRHEKNSPDLRGPLVIANLGFAEVALPHPLRLGL